jgi:sarcosine oxidase delta subunit
MEGQPNASADKKPVPSAVNPRFMNGLGQASSGKKAQLKYVQDVIAPAVYDPLTRQYLPNKTAIRLASYVHTSEAGNKLEMADRIFVPDSMLARPVGFTVEGFVKPVNPNVKWANIIRKDLPANCTWGLATEDLHPGGRLKLKILLSTENNAFLQYRDAASPNMRDESWHHFAYVYDPRDGTATLYWDHKQVVQQKIASEFNRKLLYPDPKLGRKHGIIFGDDKRGFNGLLDEVRLTGAILKPEQFLRPAQKPDKTPPPLMSDAAATTETDASDKPAAKAVVVGYWRLEGEYGQSAADQAVPSETHPDKLTGKGVKAGQASQLVYTADTPGRWISDPSTGKSYENKSSMRFANADIETDDKKNTIGDYIRIEDDPLLHVGSFTLEGFVKPDKPNAKWETLIAKLSETNRSWGLDTSQLDPGNRLKLRMLLKLKGGRFMQYRDGQSPDLRDANWHHFAYTYDETTGAMTLYWDYQKATETSIPEKDKRTIQYDKGPKHPMLIGARIGRSGWNGWMDEIRLTRGVLSVDQFLRAGKTKP